MAGDSGWAGNASFSTMTTHSRLLAEIVERLRQSTMDCGVILIGSVQAGQERPGSDLDLCLVFQGSCDLQCFAPTVLHQEKGMTLFESRIEGVTVHFACWPTEALDRAISEEPFTYYPLARGEIVHDTRGLARGCQRQLQEYFRTHPALSAAWDEQTAALRRYKAGEETTLRYPEWGEFAQHLRELIEGATEDRA